MWRKTGLFPHTNPGWPLIMLSFSHLLPIFLFPLSLLFFSLFWYSRLWFFGSGQQATFLFPPSLPFILIQNVFICLPLLHLIFNCSSLGLVDWLSSHSTCLFHPNWLAFILDKGGLNTHTSSVLSHWNPLQHPALSVSTFPALVPFSDVSPFPSVHFSKHCQNWKNYNQLE